VPLSDHPQGGVLSLDLSGHVGVCYAPLNLPRDEPPAFATWHLPYVGGEGGRYAAFEDELGRTLDELEPSKLLLEAPLPLPAQTHMRTCQQQLTLRGIAYMEAWRASVAVFEVDALTVRGAVLGQARFSKGIAKREVVQWCRRRGWKVPTHDAADAALLWEYYRRQIAGVPKAAGPLWREAY
jgi:hypothetical protein